MSAGRGLVDVLRAALHTAFEIAVVVPSPVVELDHTHTALGEAAASRQLEA